MNPAIKAQWVEALRSGEYEQGKYRLRNGDKFCCLGVLCDIAHKAGVVEYTPASEQVAQDPGEETFDRYGDETGCLPLEVREWAGIDNSIPWVRVPGNKISLAGLNDGQGYDFDLIADLIEGQL
jgi:hypothetical protein